MNEQEMNVAIAEAVVKSFGLTPIQNPPGTRGYRDSDLSGLWILHDTKEGASQRSYGYNHKTPEACFEALIQEYAKKNWTRDLNAMHEAEKTLKSEQREVYAGHLAEFHQPLTSFRFLSATALQRAEAFLRTIGKFTPTPKEHE